MKVLAVGCHPDDLEICCAGTLLRCAARGDEVTICHVANGNLGHMVIPPEELGPMRIAEAKAAGAVGGFKVVTLNIGDLRVYENDVSQLEGLVKIIREADPDFIITHAPNDYMMDHRAVSKLVFDASFIASVPHYDESLGAPSRVTPIYYMENSYGLGFTPTEYVDITDVFDKKIEMLKCHKSQYEWLKDHDGVDVSEEVAAVARFRGLQCDVRYAEGFTQEYVAHKIVTKRLLP